MEGSPAFHTILLWSLWDKYAEAAAAMPPKGPHPPYTIHKVKGKFFVKNSLGEKKNKTGYDTEEEAMKLQRALYAALPPNMRK